MRRFGLALGILLLAAGVALARACIDCGAEHSRPAFERCKTCEQKHWDELIQCSECDTKIPRRVRNSVGNCRPCGRNSWSTCRECKTKYKGGGWSSHCEDCRTPEELIDVASKELQHPTGDCWQCGEGFYGRSVTVMGPAVGGIHTTSQRASRITHRPVKGAGLGEFCTPKCSKVFALRVWEKRGITPPKGFKVEPDPPPTTDTTSGKTPTSKFIGPILVLFIFFGWLFLRSRLRR